MLKCYSETWRWVPNHAFGKASAPLQCNELCFSPVSKVCRLAVDFLHIHSYPCQLMMSEPQATKSRQCSDVATVKRSQSPDTEWHLVAVVAVTWSYLCTSNVCGITMKELMYFPDLNWSGCSLLEKAHTSSVIQGPPPSASTLQTASDHLFLKDESLNYIYRNNVDM